MRFPLAAGIVSCALIVSSVLFNLGQIAASSDRGNVLNVDGGAVRLGRVDAEREFISIKMVLSKDQALSLDMSGSELEEMNNSGIKAEYPAFNIPDAAPQSIVSSFKDELRKALAYANKDKKEEKDMLKLETMSGIKGAAIKITSKIVYSSAINSAFPLTVVSETFIIEPGKPLLPAVTAKIDEVIKTTQKVHQQNTFM